MIIGYMRNELKPTRFHLVNALIAKARGIELLYFNAEDVDMVNNVIVGRIVNGKKWERVEREIPKIVDVSPFCYKHRVVVNYLRDRTYLTDSLRNRLTKEKLQDLLKRDKELSQYMLPSQKIETYKNIQDFIDEFGEVVIKPVKSTRGRGVFIVAKKGDKLVVGNEREETVMSLHEFQKFYIDYIKDTTHIVQKAIDSRLPSGDPFDCRIHLEKNGRGKWDTLDISVRIGLGQKVVSHVSNGSSRLPIKPFLEMQYAENADDIYSNLREVAFLIARKIERVRKTKLMSLGVDVGIDKSGEIFIFGTNSAPRVDVIESKVAIMRTDYYEHLNGLLNKSKK